MREVAAAPQEKRSCTCHPSDNPPQPCPEKYALSECRAAAPQEGKADKYLMEEAQNYADHLMNAEQFHQADIVQRLIDALRAPPPATPRGDGGEHPYTEACGFDRNASLTEDTYVCTCGYRTPPAATDGFARVPKEPTEEMVEAAGREYWAQTRRTNGPRTLKEWASSDIMREVYEGARITLRAGIAAAPQSGKKED